MTHSQVEALATESTYPDFVRFLAYTGLRRGEATGLRVGHVDQSGALIVENAVNVNGKMVMEHPKRERAVPLSIPRSWRRPLNLPAPAKRVMLSYGATESSTSRPGNAISGWFGAARKRAQVNDPSFPTLTPHDLRHTAASLAISAGANIKVLQRMLGHASAAMTLDRYADLFEDDLDSVVGRSTWPGISLAKNWQRNRCEVTFSTVGECDQKSPIWLECQGFSGFSAKQRGRRNGFKSHRHRESRAPASL